MESKRNMKKNLLSLLLRKKNEEKDSLLGRKFRLGEFLAEYIIKSVSFISFTVIILIFVFVFREALPVLSDNKESSLKEPELVQETYGEERAVALADIPKQAAEKTEMEEADHNPTLKNLSGDNWQPVSDEPKYGLLPLFVGSLKVTLIAVLIGGPIAILAALFSAILAPKRLKEIIKPATELLAGFPSVVIGFFALVALATLFQHLFGYQYRLNAFIGGLALSLAVIPVVFTVADDALTAVPKQYLEASLALGTTKWQTALFVILPAATPGVFAALLLGVGRAFGETMIVLMATGNASLLSFGIFEPVRTMSATIGAEMAEVVFGDTHYNVLFLIGAILFVFTFILNAVAEFYVRNKLIKKFRGS